MKMDTYLFWGYLGRLNYYLGILLISGYASIKRLRTPDLNFTMFIAPNLILFTWIVPQFWAWFSSVLFCQANSFAGAFSYRKIILVKYLDSLRLGEVRRGEVSWGEVRWDEVREGNLRLHFYDTIFQSLLKSYKLLPPLPPPCAN